MRIRIQRAENSVHLLAAFGRAQPEMRRHHAQLAAFDVEPRVDRAARLMAADGQVDVGSLLDGKARQQRVAVVRGAPRQRASDHDVHVERRAHLAQEFAVHRERRYLLQRDDVGAELLQHRDDASRVVPPVAADAAVDVPGRKSQAAGGWRRFIRH